MWCDTPAVKLEPPLTRWHDWKEVNKYGGSRPRGQSPEIPTSVFVISLHPSSLISPDCLQGTEALFNHSVETFCEKCGGWGGGQECTPICSPYPCLNKLLHGAGKKMQCSLYEFKFAVFLCTCREHFFLNDVGFIVFVFFVRPQEKPMAADVCV